MSIATTVRRYLAENNIPYELIDHPYSHSTLQSSIAAMINAGECAKAVILKDPVDNYLMAVLPANHRLQLRPLKETTEQNLRLAHEQELQHYFNDCEPGAIPPLGMAYDMELVWDDTLAKVQDIYMESGDHRQLIHISSQSFLQLMGDQPHACFSALTRSGSSPFINEES